MAGILCVIVLAAGFLQTQSQAGLPAAIQIDTRPATAQAALQQNPQTPAIQLERTNPAGQALIVADVDSTSLRELLSGFAQTSGLNLAMPPQLDRLVSVDIRNATIEEALETILVPLNLEYRIDGRILHVFEPQMSDATLEFNYVTTSRTRSATIAGSAAPGAGGVSVISSDAIDLNEEVEKLLLGAKSKDGNVQSNRTLGLYFVHDYPRNIARMRSILDQLQVAADRQVVIEAKLLEVELNEDSQGGIDWNEVFSTVSAASSSFSYASPLQLTFAGKDFEVLIRALAAYGSVNVLAAPTVSTLNNQPAVVRIGTQDVFFSTSITTDPRTGAILQTTETPSTVTEGVMLDLTPRVSPDGTIYMSVHPVITGTIGQRTSARGASAPVVDLTEADTVIRTRNGDSVIIAGLIKQAATANDTGLRNAPLIRFIAGRPSVEVRKTELVILLTPRIVNLQTAPRVTN
jgi:type II secretory pathway component HofQ